MRRINIPGNEEAGQHEIGLPVNALECLVETSRDIAGHCTEQQIEDEGEGDQRAAIGWGQETEAGKH